MNDPIVLEPELKSSKKYLNQAKYSKIFKKILERRDKI